MTNEQRSDQWPHVVSSRDADTTVFQPVTVTIRKVFAGDYGVGWGFKEDTTPSGKYKGVIWNHRDVYDEDSDHYVAYEGPKYAAEQTVTVSLSVEKTKTGKPRYLVRAIKPATGTPAATESAGTPAQAPVDLADPQRRSIEKQVAFKGLTDVVANAVGLGNLNQLLFTEDEMESIKSIWTEMMHELATGQTLPQPEPKDEEPPEDSDTPLEEPAW